MKNQNDPTSQFYDIVSKAMKPDEITNQEIDLIEDILNKDTNKTILDVGCGTGRHSIPLLSLGYKIFGVEESEGMLRKLKAKSTEISQIQFISENFTNESIFHYHSDITFDLIVLFWNTFNETALSDADAKELIKKLSALLSPTGKILINSDDPVSWGIDNYSYGYVTSVNGVPAEYNSTLYEYDKVSRISKTKETVTLKPAGSPEEIHETEIHQRWYSFEQYQELFGTEGFTLEKKNIKGNNEMYLVATRQE